ncbi:hypothetical protein DVW31_16340, partial [Enterococcus faecium]
MPVCCQSNWQQQTKTVHDGIAAMLHHPCRADCTGSGHNGFATDKETATMNTDLTSIRPDGDLMSTSPKPTYRRILLKLSG